MCRAAAGSKAELDQVAEEEALRSQVVLFICDGDLTRAESHAVQRLLALEKPLILVMNKSDRYSREEQSMLLERLLDQLGDLGSEFSNDQVVAVSAGGEIDAVQRQPRRIGSNRSTHTTGRHRCTGGSYQSFA